MSTTDRKKSGPTVLGRPGRFWGAMSLVLFCLTLALLICGLAIPRGSVWLAVCTWLFGLSSAGLATSLAIAAYLLTILGSRDAIERALIAGDYLPRRGWSRLRLVPRRPALLGISPGYWAVLAFIMLIPALLGPGLFIRRGPRFGYYGLVLRTPGEYRLIDSEEWTEAVADQEVGEVYCVQLEVDDALIYPYRKGRVVRVRIDMWSEPASAELVDDLCVQISRQWGLPMTPRLDAWYDVRRGSQTSPSQTSGSFAEFRVPHGPRRILWRGVAANVSILACAIAFVFFFMWWFATASDRRKLRRRWKALARSVCPSCGYDIRYLPEHRCPECGETWKPDEPRMMSKISTDRT